jgi:hypothetical protein
MMQALACPNGHQDERYLPQGMGAHFSVPSRVCAQCGHPMWAVPAWPMPLLYFSEKRPRYIENLGAEIRSHGQHVRVMKACGVEPATDWHVSRKWSDGLRTKAPVPHSDPRKRASHG